MEASSSGSCPVPSFQTRRVETLFLFYLKWPLVSALKGFLKKAHIALNQYNGSFTAHATNVPSKNLTDRKHTTGVLAEI